VRKWSADRAWFVQRPISARAVDAERADGGRLHPASIRGAKAMSRTTQAAQQPSIRFTALALVATLGLASYAQPTWSVTTRHPSEPATSSTLQTAGRQPVAWVEQGAAAGQGSDAIFRSGFGSNALSFSLANPQPNLVEVWAGSFASGDVDGDGDMDLFMSGQTPALRTKLYLNDGSGNLSELDAPFPPASGGQSILEDLDGDGDLDLFFAGNASLGNFTSTYRNNGFGVFTQIANAALPTTPRGTATPRADIADVDNDGDHDIVITSSSFADVYLNDGSGVFSPKGSSFFTPVRGVVRFIDVDNDSDQDVIISGRDASNVSSTKLHRNDGLGNFTLDVSSVFAAVRGEDIDVADTDRDGDLDVLLNGDVRNLLYLNNGSGIFSEVATGLQQTSNGQNEFADLDNDGDQDLLIVGNQVGGLPGILNIVYENQGNNRFTQAAILGGEYIAACAIADFTGDGLEDVVIQGFAEKTNVYWNTSTASE
jgi:hypothetical protein